MVEVVGVALAEAVVEGLGLVDQRVEGVLRVQRRGGGDEVEVEDFGFDGGTGDGVREDDLLDFGAVFVGVRGEGGVSVVAGGDGGDEYVGAFGGADECWEKVVVQHSRLLQSC